MTEEAVTGQKDIEAGYFSSSQHHIIGIVPESAHKILDIGGGSGVTVGKVKAHYGDGFAAVYDIFEIPVQTRYPGVDLFAQGDVEKGHQLETLFSENGPFDLVLCLDVLEHLVDPWSVVERLHDLLPIGGSIIISLPNIRHMSGFGRIAMGTWNYRASGILDRTHLRFFVKSGAIGLACGSGLELKEIYSTGRDKSRPLYRWMDILTLGLLRPFFELQYVMRVEKMSERIQEHQHGLSSFT